MYTCKPPSQFYRLPVHGIFSLMLPTFTLQVVADTMGMSEKLSVCVESNRIHIAGAETDIATLWTFWERSV